jgi:hypothetical protein
MKKRSRPKDQVVVPHPTGTLALSIARFRKAPDARGLLATLRVALESGLPLNDLEAAYRPVARQLWSVESAETLAGFLSEHADDLRPCTMSPEEQQIAEGVLARAKDTARRARALLDTPAWKAVIEREDTWLRQTQTYSGFGPARHAALVLAEYFQGADPGACIAEYIRAMDPSRSPPTSANHAPVESASGPAPRKMPSLTEDALRFVKAMLADCVTTVHEAVEAEAVALANADDLSLLAGWPHIEVGRSTVACLGECALELMQHSEVVASAPPGDKFLHQLCLVSQPVFLAVWSCRAYRRRWRPNMLRFFVALMCASPRRRKELVHHVVPDFDFGIDDPPHVCADWEELEALNECANALDSPETLRANQEFFLAWADGEVRTSDGASRLSFDELWHMAAQFQTTPELEFSARRDLRVMLAVSTARLDYAEDLHDGDDLAVRAWKYGQLVDGALRAGLEELACALLSFGLFTQAMISKGAGMALDHGRVVKQLRRLTARPGWSMVERALGVTHEILENDRAVGIDIRWVLSLRREPPLAGRRVAAPSLSREMLEARLHSMIGRESWFQLTPATKSQILDAEYQFLACHLDFGTGLQNLGAIVVSYLLAVELEVLEQFRAVMSSEAYIDYQRGAAKTEKPTLGTVIHLLASKNPLIPPAVREAVDSLGPSWVRKPESRRSLQLALELRNAAAHGDKFDQHGLAVARKMLFDEAGLLRLLVRG